MKYFLHHEIWIPTILNFEFLHNEQIFWSKIKNIFLNWQVFSFRLKKQTSKNVAETTFENHMK